MKEISEKDLHAKRYRYYLRQAQRERYEPNDTVKLWIAVICFTIALLGLIILLK